MVNDTSGVRRSPRDRDTSSSKQVTPSPPSTRKSGRLVNQIPESPPVKTTPEKIKKHVAVGPLRRSDRGKNHTSSSSLGSKKPETSGSSLGTPPLKGVREKSLKELNMEVKEVSRSEDQKPVYEKKKMMDAHSFKSLLKVQRIRKAAAGS